MSAYVVEDETIGRIVGFLFDKAAAARWEEPTLSPLAVPCKELSYNLRSEAGRRGPALRRSCERLATAMRFMNVGAVRGRYEDADERGMVGTAQAIALGHSTRPVVAYKALRCWLYQCTEGDVPNSPLYKAVEEIAAALAQEIVQALPEYDETPWG